MGDDVDINTLTMNQYLALIQDNIGPGIGKPEIDSKVKFKINGNFMRELRHKLFKDSNIRVLKTTTKNLQEKADQLTQTTLTNLSERVNAKMKMGKKDMEEPVPRDFPVVQPYVPPTPFLVHSKKQKDNPYKTHKTVGILEKSYKESSGG
nr:hypothetical protein [Tanacetum cinerariifolium]